MAARTTAATTAWPDVSSWFEDDELEPCPRCHERKLLREPTSDGGRVCIACGPLSIP